MRTASYVCLGCVSGLGSLLLQAEVIVVLDLYPFLCPVVVQLLHNLRSSLRITVDFVKCFFEFVAFLDNIFTGNYSHKHSIVSALTNYLVLVSIRYAWMDGFYMQHSSSPCKITFPCQIIDLISRCRNDIRFGSYHEQP